MCCECVLVRPRSSRPLSSIEFVRGPRNEMMARPANASQRAPTVQCSFAGLKPIPQQREPGSNPGKH
jgi:hypothetical protein